MWSTYTGRIYTGPIHMSVHLCRAFLTDDSTVHESDTSISCMQPLGCEDREPQWVDLLYEPAIGSFLEWHPVHTFFGQYIKLLKQVRLAITRPGMRTKSHNSMGATTAQAKVHKISGLSLA